MIRYHAHDVDTVEQVAQCFYFRQGVAIPDDLAGDTAKADVDVFGSCRDPGDTGMQAVKGFVYQNSQMIQIKVISGGMLPVLEPSRLGDGR